MQRPALSNTVLQAITTSCPHAPSTYIPASARGGKLYAGPSGSYVVVSGWYAPGPGTAALPLLACPPLGLMPRLHAGPASASTNIHAVTALHTYTMGAICRSAWPSHAAHTRTSLRSCLCVYRHRLVCAATTPACEAVACSWRYTKTYFGAWTPAVTTQCCYLMDLRGCPSLGRTPQGLGCCFSACRHLWASQGWRKQGLQDWACSQVTHAHSHALQVICWPTQRSIHSPYQGRITWQQCHSNTHAETISHAAFWGDFADSLPLIKHSVRFSPQR